MHLRASRWWNARSDRWYIFNKFYDILAWQNNILMRIVTSVFPSKYTFYAVDCVHPSMHFYFNSAYITISIWYKTFAQRIQVIFHHIYRVLLPSFILDQSLLTVLLGVLLMKWHWMTLSQNFIRAYIAIVIWQINKFEKLDTQSIWSTSPFNSKFYTTDIISRQRFIFNFSSVFFYEKQLIYLTTCLQITKPRFRSLTRVEFYRILKHYFLKKLSKHYE